MQAKFHMETQDPVLREASSVHTFISFPISDVLTRKRILVGNRSQVKLLGKQTTKYITIGARASQRGAAQQKVGWFWGVRSPGELAGR